MSRAEKVKIIDNLAETFSKCSVGVLTDYRGISASDMNVLRRKLREANIEYRVVKNTLARFAGEKAGKNELVELFEGPVAIAFGYDEITIPAKVLTDYIQASQANLSIKGGFLEDRMLTPREIETLSTLPSKEVLLAKLLGSMQSPIATLMNCLSSPLQWFIGTLQARIKQMEEN